MTFEQRSFDGRAASCSGARSWKRVSVDSTMKSITCLLGCLVLATLLAHAQGVGTSGEITGTVSDSSGGVMPRATVNVVDTQTGFKRTTATNSTGQFRFAGLPPATYDI